MCRARNSTSVCPGSKIQVDISVPPSSLQQLQQRVRVVAAEMHDAVNEQCRGTAHLTGLDSAPEVSLDPVEDRGLAIDLSAVIGA